MTTSDEPSIGLCFEDTDMRKRRLKDPNRYTRLNDRGQVTILVVIALAVFLMGFVGFAVDMTNLWFHRQMAQGAADAACQAGIMNVMVHTPTMGFTPGTGFTCAAGSTATPCRYAALNGYAGGGLVADAPSSRIDVSFPGTPPAGMDTSILPPTAYAPFPFLRVDLTDRVKMYFAPLITGNVTQDVHAQAICGLTFSKAPIPIIILNPTCTHPFEISGSATLKVVGGPTRSVQVNSSNQTCAAATTPTQCSGNGTVDLSQGGPNFTGSGFGVFGAPSTAPPGFLPGTTGVWANTAPIEDPFIQVPPPAVPPQSPTDTGGAGPIAVPYGVSGCPDHTGGTSALYGTTTGCFHFKPGLYTKPIVVKQVTAIFDPGIYYIQPASSDMDSDGCGTPGEGCVSKPTGQCWYDFAVNSSGVVRPSTDLGDGSGGTMFYLSGSGTGTHPYGSVFFGSNAGTYGGRTIDPYPTSNMVCPGGDPIDSRTGVPASAIGNILVGQCTTAGDYIPYEGSGSVRGIVFFGDRNNGTNGTYINGQPAMSGGGGLAISGSLYFTNCPGWGTSGLDCVTCSCPPVGYNAFLQLQGNPGSGTYVIGNITADELNEAGNGTVAMQLDPNRIRWILKATLVR